MSSKWSERARSAGGLLARSLHNGRAESMVWWHANEQRRALAKSLVFSHQSCCGGPTFDDGPTTDTRAPGGFQPNGSLPVGRYSLPTRRLDPPSVSCALLWQEPRQQLFHHAASRPLREVGSTQSDPYMSVVCRSTPTPCAACVLHHLDVVLSACRRSLPDSDECTWQLGCITGVCVSPCPPPNLADDESFFQSLNTALGRVQKGLDA